MGKLVARAKERDRTSEGTRMVSATNWKSRGDTTHAETLHIYTREGEREREDARAEKDPPRGRGRERDRGIERDGKCDTGGAVERRQARW